MALSTNNISVVDRVVNKRFRIIEEIGRGSFGSVQYGRDLMAQREVAIKLEQADYSRQSHHLSQESEVYKILQGCPGVATYYFYGHHQIDRKMYNVLVMDLLGPSLEKYLNMCHRRFSLKTVLMLADQMLALLEYMHFSKLLHGDIKPENFVMGRRCTAKENQVFIIDFGLSRPYIVPSTNNHIEFIENKGTIVGTARYASVNVLLGNEQSRRDDMESLAYVLLYFLRGKLPWQGINAATHREKFKKICDCKAKISTKELCQGFPTAFERFLDHCKGLKFDECPNYIYLRSLFQAVFHGFGYKHDFVYDWHLLKKHQDDQEQSEDQDSSSYSSSDEIIEISSDSRSSSENHK
jgi:serine/threonine protein kinase